MNFIDEALENAGNGNDFVEAMADIFEHDEVRELLGDYPEWVRNIITVIDYDTELSMEGLDFRSYNEEIIALRSMGLFSEADALAPVCAKTSDADIEKCYSRLALNNDYDAFWQKVYDYAEENLKKLR